MPDLDKLFLDPDDTQKPIDIAMLKSMAAVFSEIANDNPMDFSFHPQDMADLLERCANRIK